MLHAIQPHTSRLTLLIGTLFATCICGVAHAQQRSADRGRPTGERRVEHIAQRPHESRPIANVRQHTRARADAAMGGALGRPNLPRPQPRGRK